MSNDQASTEFKPGFTKGTVLALTVVAFIFIPISVYVFLVGGATMGAASVYVIIILYSQFSRVMGHTPSRQEMLVIYESAAIAGGGLPFYFWLIYNGFFRTSPVINAFLLNGSPLSDFVPDWLAPPAGNMVYLTRELLSPVWVKPIILNVQITATLFVTNLALAMLFSHMYIEVEPLEFPFARVDASIVNTITSLESERIRDFLLGLTPGVAYGLLLYGAPLTLGRQVIPVPWVDLTSYTEAYMPGALIGLMTDPSFFLLGLLVPFSTSVSIMIGSISTWIFGNWLFLTVFPQAFPLWVKEYIRGLGLTGTYQRSLVRVWYAPQVGLFLGVAVFVVIRYARQIARALKTLARAGDVTSRVGFPRLRYIIGLYLIGTVGSVLFFEYITDWSFPFLLALVVSVGLSFVLTIVNTRMTGEFGYGLSLPYLWQALVYVTPYQGYIAWVVPPAIGGQPGGAPTLVQMTKAAYLTETKPFDLYKALATAILLNAVIGFISIYFFWKLSPIPSSAYPYTLIFFPTQAIQHALIATRQIGFDPIHILISAIIACGVMGSGVALSALNIPFSPMGVIAGTATIPPQAIMLFLGSTLGQFALTRVFGALRWREMRSRFVGGVLTGAGISVGFLIAISLLSKAAWVWPW